jgi:outer membrane protein
MGNRGLTALVAVVMMALFMAARPVQAMTYEDAEAAWQAGRHGEADRILTTLLRENPGDLKVNFLLGQVSLARGKTSHAAFAFERVLSLQPGNQRARLELARAYYLMGQYTQAQLLFQEVMASDPPPEVRKNIDAFLVAIERAEEKWLVNGQINLSVFYDDNVNYGPADEEIDTLLGTLLVAPPAQEADTVGLALSGGANMMYDGGMRDAWQFISGASGYNSWLSDETDQEILFGRASAGAQYVGSKSLARLEGVFDHLNYGGESLLNAYGAAARWNQAIDEDWLATFNGKVEQRDYTDNEERDALYGEARFTAHRLLEKQRYRVHATVGAFREDAEIDGFSNQGWLAELGAEASLPFSVTAYATAGYRVTDYDEILLASLQGSPREDEQWQVSLGLQKKLTPRTGMDLNVRHVNNDSNFGLYAYERNVVTLSTYVNF